MLSSLVSSLREGAVAQSFCSLGIHRLLGGAQRLIYGERFIRAINYHDAPRRLANQFEQHLIFLARHFTGVNLENLEAFLFKKEWPHKRPGVILSFDDGLRTHYDIVRPLLEKHGFTGWFLIPTDFIDTPVDEQLNFAEANRIQLLESYEDNRVAMTWSEVAELDKHHVMVAHTKSHVRMKHGLERDHVMDQMRLSKERLEEKLGHEIPVFGWVGGEKTSYCRQAAECVMESGYRIALMTKSAPITVDVHPLQLHRTSVDPSWSVGLLRYHICGIMDLLYMRQRAFINRLTDVHAGR